MKKLLLLGALVLSYWASAQSYFSVGTDVLGDDAPFAVDVTDLSYAISPGQDSLYVKITHAKPRPISFGFALAIDTNLNTSDGSSINQTNIANNMPNTSMNYDLLLFGYQNSFVPGIYTEAYGSSSGIPINLDFELDTVDTYFSVFRIALDDIGGNYDLNLIGFCGGFDIVSAGPSDAVPNSTYGEVRNGAIGQAEQKVSGFRTYPNPAHKVVQVEGVKDGEHILIRDTSGKVVQDLEVKDGEIELPLPLDGLYFLQQEGGKNVLKMQFQP